jgi:hypothetical protein
MRVIKEFALEPRAVADWEHFRYFYEKLGFSRGCLAVKVPSSRRSPGWEMEVLNACSDELDRRRIEEAFRRFGGRRLCDPPRLGGARPESWREYVMAVHLRRELAGVVTAADPSDPSAKPPFMRRDDVTEAFFDLRREWSAPYAVDVIAEVCRPLLRMSPRAMIVDPYFKPASRNRLNVLERLLKVARDEGCAELVILTDAEWLSDESGAPLSQDKVLDDVRRAVPADRIAVTLHGFELRQDSSSDLHHRFLLSEVGAIRFDKGFEATARANDIALVDDSYHAELVLRYLGNLEASVGVRCTYRWPKPRAKFHL